MNSFSFAAVAHPNVWSTVKEKVTSVRFEGNISVEIRKHSY